MAETKATSASSSSSTEEEPKLTLPIGHPQAGYVSPDLSYSEGTGILPDDEKKEREERQKAYDEEVKAVADAEHKAAKAEQDAKAKEAAEAAKASA